MARLSAIKVYLVRLEVCGQLQQKLIEQIYGRHVSKLTRKYFQIKSMKLKAIIIIHRAKLNKRINNLNDFNVYSTIDLMRNKRLGLRICEETKAEYYFSPYSFLLSSIFGIFV